MQDWLFLVSIILPLLVLIWFGVQAWLALDSYHDAVGICLKLEVEQE